MERPADQARTEAAATVAWLIVVNKPFYPLYVWWLVGSHAALASTATMLTAPLYASIPFLAREWPARARLALPLVGLIDTLLATKWFGAAAGTETFLFDCALLAVVVFGRDEYRLSRGCAAAIVAAFAILHGRYGASLGGFATADAARLFDLNAYSAAALTFFIVWRFSRPK